MRKRLSFLSRRGEKGAERGRRNRLRWASGGNFVGCLLCGAYSNHSSHANVNVAVKVSMKCSMKIKCARNKSAMRVKKTEREQVREGERGKGRQAKRFGSKTKLCLAKPKTCGKQQLCTSRFCRWRRLLLKLWLIWKCRGKIFSFSCSWFFFCCCFSIFLVYCTRASIYFLFSLVFVLLIRHKIARQVPPSVDLSVALPHSLSHYLYGYLFLALFVCVCACWSCLACASLFLFLFSFLLRLALN